MAMNSSLRSVPMDTSMSNFGGNTANIAACVDSGMARTTSLVASSTSPAAEHARWVFDYDETAEDDDEAGYRFGNHAFRNGEYVSIRGEDGHMHTFQVVSVEPAT
jgi:hypothetical protein